MFFIPKMAFRNLGRYKKRTIITSTAISFGLLMFTFVRSILAGAEEESVRNLKLYETSTGRIMQSGYWEDRDSLDLEKSFVPDRLEAFLGNSDGVTGYSPRVNFAGELVFYKDPFPEDGSIPGLFTAIDPVQDNEVFQLKDSLSRGTWIRDGVQEVVIGEWLAEDIGADVGHNFLISTNTRDGYFQLFEVRVSGILNCPNPNITRSGIFIPLSVADELLEMDGQVTEINVNMGLGQKADENFAALSAGLNGLGLEAVGWEVLGADFISVSQSKASGNFLIVLMIFMIAGVGISNTMMMAVFERVRELGILRALGMKQSQIRALFLWESAGIGIISGITGTALSVLLNVFLVNKGLDYSTLMRDSSFGYRIQGNFYGTWDVPGMILAFFIGVMICVLVAFFSTHKILKLDIPASIRFQ